MKESNDSGFLRRIPVLPPAIFLTKLTEFAGLTYLSVMKITPIMSSGAHV
jgi:hypothetical protein